mgnify:CR=1 FL=1
MHRGGDTNPCPICRGLPDEERFREGAFASDVADWRCRVKHLALIPHLHSLSRLTYAIDRGHKAPYALCLMPSIRVSIRRLENL